MVLLRGGALWAYILLCKISLAQEETGNTVIKPEEKNTDKKIPAMPMSYKQTETWKERDANGVEITQVRDRYYDIESQQFRENVVVDGIVEYSIINLPERDDGVAIEYDSSTDKCQSKAFTDVIQAFPVIDPNTKYTYEGKMAILDGSLHDAWSNKDVVLREFDFRVWMNGSFPIQVYSSVDKDGGIVGGLTHISFFETMIDEFVFNIDEFFCNQNDAKEDGVPPYLLASKK